MKGRRGDGEKRERGKKMKGASLGLGNRGDSKSERQSERGGWVEREERGRQREGEGEKREKATLFLQNNALTSQKDAARNATICTIWGIFHLMTSSKITPVIERQCLKMLYSVAPTPELSTQISR